ncbi:MAG TPA: hypothetical protein VFS34_01395 [Thermoanaerobaculia bacterium]|nr:hypothetical protein [Thermoanaerobaculia bacterium]
MEEYWVHCSPIEPGGRPRFSVFQVDEGGQRILSPPGRLGAPAEVVSLLLDRGADPRGAERAIADATRQGIGRVVVAKPAP